MNANPLVSVIMPVYNGEKYIEEAIQSVINQTYSPIEIIVINDGSTDRTKDILEQYRDRIIFRSQANKGAAESLNYGVSLANGKYFARLDADDIALPDRIVKQVALLEKHAKTGICGSSAMIINEVGDHICLQKMPLADIEIRWKSLFTSPFVSSSVMARMEIIKSYGVAHNPAFQPAEDYGFWSDILKHGDGFNLEDTLVYYRVHQNSISTTKREIQQSNQVIIARENIKILLDKELSDFDVKNLCLLTSLDTKSYKTIKIDIQFTLLQFLDLWQLFKEKFSSSREIEPLEQKVLAQSFGILMIYVPIRDKGEVIRKLTSIRKNWILVIPRLIIPYIKKFLTYQQIKKYR